MSIQPITPFSSPSLPLEDSVAIIPELRRAIKDLPADKTQAFLDYFEASKKMCKVNNEAQNAYLSKPEIQAFKNKFGVLTTRLEETRKKIDSRKVATIALLANTIGTAILAVSLSLPFFLPLTVLSIAFLGINYHLQKTYKHQHSELEKEHRKLLEEKQELDKIHPEPKLDETLRHEYNALQDLDCKTIREKALDFLSTASIEQIAKSPWSNDQMIQYGLLDRVKILDTPPSPQFYATTMQLVEAYRRIQQEHEVEKKQAELEFESRQSKIYDNEGRNAYLLRYHTNPAVQIQGNASVMDSVYTCESLKNKEQLKVDIKKIDEQFNLAKQKLEKQFIAAKQQELVN